MVVRWEKTSIQDLKDFKNHSKFSNINAYITKMVSYVDNLAEQPLLGKLYLYTKGYIVRQLIYKKHKIFYYIEEDIIHIIAIIHHRQNVQEKIKFIKNIRKFGDVP